MLSINVYNSLISIGNIRKHQLNEILEWYNMTEEYKYATGKEGPISIRNLNSIYEQVTDSKNEFFLGINKRGSIPSPGIFLDTYKKNAPECFKYISDGRLLGFIRGRYSEKTLWITLMAIDKFYQGKNIGTISISLLLSYLKNARHAENAYLAVAEKNIQGRGFWFKNRFDDIKVIENHILFGGNKCNVIVMHSNLLV